MRGGIDFNYANCADSRQDGQQPPIVIASAGCVFHYFSSTGKMLPDFPTKIYRRRVVADGAGITATAAAAEFTLAHPVWLEPGTERR